MGLWRKLVAFGFRLLYNELAWTYDWVSWAVSMGRWRSWQRTVFPHLAGQRLLEVAFGTGDLLLDLAEAGYRCYGLDLSPCMLRIASNKLRREGLKVPLCRARAERLPFCDEAFDSIAITFPTNFIRDPHVACELARVLRPGGRAVVVEEGYLSGQNPLGLFINWLYVVTGQREPSPLGDDQFVVALGQAGLVARQEQGRAHASQVKLIVATKK
jgi:ubiquinone/menaquinone biosynthesis C-methylase UbiE